MYALHELRERLCAELEEFADKDLTHGNLDMIDKLAHATKNLDKVIESCDGYSGRRYMMAGRNGKRDSMGRYAKDSRMVSELKELHDMTDDEVTREGLRKVIQMAESM